MFNPCQYNDDAGDSGNSEIEVIVGAEILRAVGDLRRNDNRTGRCLACGADIPQERREALAGCRHCVTCQGELDPRPYVPQYWEPEQDELEIDCNKSESYLIQTELTRLNKRKKSV
jgi:RNA polymerase-binding transcription factor DksA